MKKESLSERREWLAQSLKTRVGELNHSEELGDSAEAANAALQDVVTIEVARCQRLELQQMERCEAVKNGTRRKLCECCGKTIPKARINARPYATRCVRCQQDKERFSPSGEDDDNTSWDKVEQEEKEGRADRLFDDPRRAMDGLLAH